MKMSQQSISSPYVSQSLKNVTANCYNIFFPIGDENVTARYFFTICFIRFVVTFVSPIDDENVTTRYFFPLCFIMFEKCYCKLL